MFFLAFYVTNRQDGFCISCSLLARSKFYGNSTSAILDGVATVTLYVKLNKIIKILINFISDYLVEKITNCKVLMLIVREF